MTLQEMMYLPILTDFYRIFFWENDALGIIGTFFAYNLYEVYCVIVHKRVNNLIGAERQLLSMLRDPDLERCKSEACGLSL